MGGCQPKEPKLTNKFQRQIQLVKDINSKYSDNQCPEAKIVLLGDSNVGKTSIVGRFCLKKFIGNQPNTICADYLQEKIKTSNGKILKLHIWDTAGSEQYKALMPMYIREADGAIIVYDVSKEKSFESVHYWINELSKVLSIDKVILALAGNKSDISKEEKKISYTVAKKFADEYSMIFFETSALSGDGVNELFAKLSNKLIDNISQRKDIK